MINEIKEMLERGEIVELECVDRDGFLSEIHTHEANMQILKQGKLFVAGVDFQRVWLSGFLSSVGNFIGESEFKYFKIKEKSYTEKLLDRDSKFTEILRVATKAVNNGDLSSFVVNAADSSDKIGRCLYIGANMTYHAIENEIKGLEMKEELEVKEEVKTSDFYDLIDVAVKAYKDGMIDNLEITKGVSGGAGVLVNGNRQFTNSRPNEGIDFINSLYTETFVIESEGDISRVKSGADIKLANGNKCTFLNNDDMWRIKDDKGFSHNCGLLVLKGATVTQKRGNK